MSVPPKMTIFLILILVACSNDSVSTAVVPLPVSAAPVPSGEGAFWPCFHGPNGDNISPDTGLLQEWPDAGPPLVWTAEGIGHGFSGVTIAGDLIYTDGNIDDKTTVTAIDMDGQVRWQSPIGKGWTGSHDGTRGTPTIDGNRVYHESPMGDVVCLDAKTGEKIWGVNILDEFDSKNIKWALAESVLIDGDRVICSPGGPKASVVALDKKTGQTVWTGGSTGDLAGYATPTIAECGGLRMILTMSAKALIGVNADNGDLLFRHEHITKYDVNALKPIYHDGRVFISSGYGSGSAMVKLDVQGGKVTAEEVWTFKELDNHHGGVMLLDGYLYGSSARGMWICLDWKTGEKMYGERGIGKGSVTFADGMLYMMNEKRGVGLAKPTPAGHTVVSRFEIPAGGREPTWAHPVVCGGRLYLRHSDRLFAYDVRAKQ